MNLTKQQIQRFHKASNRQIPQFSRPVVWVLRIAIIGLFSLWIAGGLYLNYQVKQDERRIEETRLEAQRREERIRRGTQYKQELQERTQTPRSRNVFEGR